MVVATVAFCVGACLIGGAGIFLVLNLFDHQALRTLRRVRPSPLAGLRDGRVAVRGRIEYGPSGRQIGPVTGQECAWFHVRLCREPGRASDADDVLLDLSSPGGFALADHSGRVPVDPEIVGPDPRIAVRTTVDHRRRAPVPLPAVVPRRVVDDLRKSERLTLTEIRVPRGADVFALGRLAGGELRPSRAGLTVFTADSREQTIAAREESIGHVARLIAGFGLVGLVLAGGGAGLFVAVA